MKKTWGVAGIAIVMVVMAGCSTGSPEETDTQTQSAAVAPVVSQSVDMQSGAQSSDAVSVEEQPIELDKAQAGDLFLDVVCGVNEKVDSFNETSSAAHEQYVNGDDPEMSELRQTAGVLADASLQAITVFDDEHYVWPESVRDLISTMRGNYMAETQMWRNRANSDNYEGMLDVPVPQIDSPSQEIRYQLDLESDPITSCSGHHGKLVELAEQSKSRKD